MKDKFQTSTEKFSIDSNIVNSKSEKQVKFSDEKSVQEVVNTEVKTNKETDLFTISDESKLIALASLMFFLFIDSKLKKYIINILTQIFGEFIKTDTGGTSKLGNLFYSFTFGLVLYLFTVFVDYTTLQFDF